MKLAFCIFNFFPHGGLEKDFLIILNECLSRGHQIDIYTMTWQGDIPENINIFYISSKSLTNHARAKNFSDQCKKTFSQKKYDVILGFNKIENLDIYFAGDHCFIKNVPRWKLLLPRYRTYYSLEKSIFSPHSHTQILSLTSQQEQDFIDYYQTPKNRFILLPPHVDKSFKKINTYLAQRSQLRAELGLSPTDKMILMVASFFKTKGVDRALKAFAELTTPAQLFIIGGDDPSAYSAAHNIHFMGAQDNVMPFYAAADLFFHPAYKEAAGKVLIEALVAGLPILTTDICGYSPYVVEARAGIVLSSPYNQTNCNQVLAQLLNQPLEKYRDNALKFAAMQNFYALGETVADIIEGHA